MKHYLKSFYRYHLRGNWQYWQAKKALLRAETPIVIYTMGKVGSLSLYHSLKKQIQNPVFHVHSLKKERIEWEYQTCREKGWWPDSKSPGDLIYQHKILTKQPVHFITAVREPIERNVSAFFEVFRYYNGVDVADYKGSTKGLQEQFLKSLPHELPLNWLDEELKTCLNIDVYQTPFDHEQKYQFYQKEQLNLLLLRVDLPDAEKEKQVQNFLGISSFKLHNQNIGADKDYALFYQKFKTEIILPKSYLEKLLESPYCQHFYSPAERKAQYLKWTKS